MFGNLFNRKPKTVDSSKTVDSKLTPLSSSLGSISATISEMSASHKKMCDTAIELINENTALKLALIAKDQENVIMKQLLQDCDGVYNDMFDHCLSSGVFNAWGGAMNCTKINEVKNAVQCHLKAQK